MRFKLRKKIDHPKTFIYVIYITDWAMDVDFNHYTSKFASETDIEFEESVSIILNGHLVYTSNSPYSAFAGSEKGSRSLLHDLGVVVSSRFKPALEKAMDAIIALIESGPEYINETLLNYISIGLSYLREELSYYRDNNSQINPIFIKEEIPNYRYLVIKMVSKLYNSSLQWRDSMAIEWLKLGMDDPLPEVRNIALKFKDKLTS